MDVPFPWHGCPRGEPLKKLQMELMVENSEANDEHLNLYHQWPHEKLNIVSLHSRITLKNSRSIVSADQFRSQLVRIISSLHSPIRQTSDAPHVVIKRVCCVFSRFLDQSLSRYMVEDESWYPPNLLLVRLRSLSPVDTLITSIPMALSPVCPNKRRDVPVRGPGFKTPASYTREWGLLALASYFVPQNFTLFQQPLLSIRAYSTTCSCRIRGDMNHEFADQALDSFMNADFDWMQHFYPGQAQLPEPSQWSSTINDVLEMELLHIINAANNHSHMMAAAPAINTAAMSSWDLAAATMGSWKPDLDLRWNAALHVNSFDPTSVTATAVPLGSCSLITKNTPAAVDTSALHEFPSAFRNDPPALPPMEAAGGSAPLKPKRKRQRPSRRTKIHWFYRLIG